MVQTSPTPAEPVQSQSEARLRQTSQTWLEVRIERVIPPLGGRASPMDHQRARALVVLTWILVPAGLGFSFLYHVVLGTHYVGLPGAFLTASITAAYILLTQTGRVRFAAHLVAFGTWIALAWGMSLSGGIASPYAPFAVLMMVWIGVLHTGRDTAISGVITGVTFLGFAGLETAGITFPDGLAAIGARAVTLVSVPVGITVVVGLTALSRLMERRARLHTEQLNTELAAALVQAEAAAEVKRLFLATMSHELRTPLNAVFASMEMLELKGELSPEAQRYLTRMHRAGESLLSVINDTIDWSRLESGGLSLHTSNVNPADLAAQVIEVLTDQARRRGLGLSLEVTSSAPSAVFTDGARLRQVLLNLLTNALAYTNEGNVSLVVRSSGEDDVLFLVKDTGPGIAEDQLPTLFEPFRRADNTKWTRARGSGLGLAICKRFTESLGGNICVHSEEGVGSVFTVRLPRDLWEPLKGQPGCEDCLGEG